MLFLRGISEGILFRFIQRTLLKQIRIINEPLRRGFKKCGHILGIIFVLIGRQ